MPPDDVRAGASRLRQRAASGIAATWRQSPWRTPCARSRSAASHRSHRTTRRNPPGDGHRNDYRCHRPFVALPGLVTRHRGRAVGRPTRHRHCLLHPLLPSSRRGGSAQAHQSLLHGRSRLFKVWCLSRRSTNVFTHLGHSNRGNRPAHPQQQRRL